jgi:ATP-dependent helicase/nuclease subunit B
LGLSLLAGPANTGKVALLLERYLARLDDQPVLIVPNRSDVAEVERDLLRRCGCLLAGSIGTFDDLFRRIADGDSERKPVATEAQRALLVRRAIRSASLNGLGRSARFGGFADALLATLAELESGLVDPPDLGDDLGQLYSLYRAELDRLGLWDRDLLRRRAADRLAGDLGAWHGEPVFAYGFEDLTHAEWRLVEALAGRTDVHVSLPYEPGRPAFASLQRTAEKLSALADGRTEELPPRQAEYSAPALAHLERALFAEAGLQSRTPIEGAVWFLEGAGPRGLLELVGEELLALVREGMPADQIALVCPSVDRWRAPLETVLGTLGIPYAVESRTRVGATAFGYALLSILRYAWAGAGRRELFAFLRSPYSGLGRGSVDFVEGRLRGRAIQTPERVEEETERLREAPIPTLRDIRAADDPIAGVRALVRSMLRAAYGVDAPPSGETSRLDLRAYNAVWRLLDDLDGWEHLDDQLSREDVLAALERAEVNLSSWAEPGRVAVLDLMRARTRRFDVVFILGLEEGSLPRREDGSPFLDADRRRELRLERPNRASRDRYLFYTACTRPTRRLYLAREAATDEGGPRGPSPFWEEAAAAFDGDDVAHHTRRRPLSQLSWTLDVAPSERERLRALARLAVDDPDAATVLADANGWTRRLVRARRAFDRDTTLRNPVVLADLAGRSMFGATELERFADCSSAWLFDRVVDPKTIDAEVDAKLRGSVAHQALFRFYAGLPKELGTDHVTGEKLEAALGFMRRCLDEALRGGTTRLDLTPVQELELDASLWRDLENFVRDEASSHLGLQPKQFEVSFGSDRSAPHLQRGLELGDGVFLSGKIDRIDVDPFSARGIVQDYKSGKGAHSARQIDEERRLQVPLYMLVLRDLVGIEPLGGIYRALSGARATRGMLREEAREDLPGFKQKDYLGEEEFWAQVETTRERGLAYAQRIKRGDVRHDPKGGDCPAWCDLWTMCRVPRQ